MLYTIEFGLINKGNYRQVAIELHKMTSEDRTKFWLAFNDAYRDSPKYREASHAIQEEFSFVQHEMEDLGKKSIVGKTVALFEKEDENAIILTMVDGSQYKFYVSEGNDAFWHSAEIDFEFVQKEPIEQTKLSELIRGQYGKR